MGYGNGSIGEDRFHSYFLFMIAGHMKFAPDLLFSKVSQSLSRSDVFSTRELLEISGQFATVVQDKGNIVRQWRPNLAKYS